MCIRDSTGRPIQGSEVSIGKTGNITVELPKGVDMDSKHQAVSYTHLDVYKRQLNNSHQVRYLHRGKPQAVIDGAP